MTIRFVTGHSKYNRMKKNSKNPIFGNNAGDFHARAPCHERPANPGQLQGASARLRGKPSSRPSNSGTPLSG